MAKSMFVSEDGRRFPTELEADSHDKLCKLVDEFNGLSEKLCDILREAKTADGVRFCDLQRLEVWTVVSLNEIPYVRQMTVIPFSASISLSEFSSDGRIMIDLSEGYGRNVIHREYPLNSLYATQKGANAELARVLEERIAVLQKNHAEITG